MTDEPLTAIDLDELMSRPVTELSSSDIDAIVTYHRAQRARRASGEKITKPKVDISSIMSKLVVKPSSGPSIKRRL